ncbi:MAG: alpha/beta fold hydrolase [bacterium]|nr:alpha/beta fold hydrolase [bacterium]
MVFVHGFGGDACGAWEAFPELLSDHPDFADLDLLYFGYDSRRQTANRSAEQLRQLLIDLFESLHDLLPRHLRDGRPSGLTEVFLVAHSLGAVVSRRAQIDLHLQHRPWAKYIDLLLFAPAHLGADIVALASTALSAFQLGKLGEAIVKMRWKALRDLDPAGKKTTLKKLESDTTDLLAGRAAKNLIARLVIHADDDGIIDDNRFCQDPPAETVDLTDHRSVCKPMGENTKQFRYVSGIVCRS